MDTTAPLIAEPPEVLRIPEIVMAFPVSPPVEPLRAMAVSNLAGMGGSTGEVTLMTFAGELSQA
ncbi:MAG: hypothetical protein GX307_06705 [Euryarchaeota archaeon]|nr:hypothetical protein [Euryarchaeota archaeon]